MKRFRALAFALLSAFAFLPLPAPAQDAGPVDPTPFLGDDWYGVYLMGTKSGWAHITSAREDRGGVPAVVVRSRMEMRVQSMEEKTEIRLQQRTAYEAGGSQGLLESWFLQEMGTAAVERSGTRVKDGFLIVTMQGKEEVGRETIPAPRETLRDALCGHVLAAGGAAAGTKRKAPSFDLEEGRDTEHEYEVVGTEDAFADGVRTKIVVIRQKNLETGDSFTVKASPAGRMLEMEFAGAVKVRLEPEALAKDIRYSADLFLEGLLRPDRKLGPPGKVRSLALRLRGADEALRLPSDGRQAVTREADGSLLLTIRADAPRDGLPEATAKETADALRPSAEFPCDNPEVRALARKAAGDASTPEGKVRSLVDFVGAYVEDADSLSCLSALDVLRAKKGDCSEHTLLFVALCRAEGLPARDVGGLMYAGDDLGAFGGHAWAEVALGGRWVSADPTWGEFPVDATHILQGTGNQAENTLRLLSRKVKVEVVSMETAR